MKTFGEPQRHLADVADQPSEADRANAVLAVGDTETWARLQKPMRSGPVRFVGIHEIDEALLDSISPDLVVSPLLSRRFDCLDLALRLHDLSFRGQYRVIDSTLPDPKMIVREVRSITPGLDFDIFPGNPEDIRN